MTRRVPSLVAVLTLLAGSFGMAGPVTAATPTPAADSIVVQKGAVIQTFDVIQNDSNVTPEATITSVTAAQHGTAAIGPDLRSVTYVPHTDYAGPDTFDYTVTDPADGPATATVTIKVNAPPTAADNPRLDRSCFYAPSQTFALPEDKLSPYIAGGECNLLANDTDADGTVVDWEIVTPPAHGTVTNELPLLIPGLSSDFTYAPDADYFTAPGDWVSDSFTYRAIDDDGGRSAPATVLLWIAPVNDPPTFTAGAATISAGKASSYSETWASSIDPGPNEGAQTVTFDVEGSPSNPVGLFSVAPTISTAGVLSFIAAAGEIGTATFTVTARDDGGLEDYGGSSDQPEADDTSDAVTITITIENGFPDAVDDSLTVAEDAGATAVGVLGNDADPDLDVLAITSVTQGTRGAVLITGAGTGLTYRPNANANGSDSFTYTISDGNGGSATGAVGVTINPVNDNPNAVNDGVPTALEAYLRAGPTALPVLANDVSAPDGAETLRIVSVTQGSHGVVAITGRGTGLTYAASGSTLGIDVFTYTLSDGNGGIDTATVQVNVLADTTAPKAAITGLTKKPIPGSTRLRVTVTWTLTESGSGIKSQLLQRRTDSGAWVTVALASSTTRSVSLALPRGHRYTFRVRGIDRAGNVGLFASRYLYI